MRTTLFLLAVLACCTAEAGPFRRGTRAVAAAPAAVLRTAQDVAQHMARVGRVGHWGGNPGLEGCGMGATPEQAKRNCCYFGRMRIEDEGVAQGSNGMYYACIRGR